MDEKSKNVGYVLMLDISGSMDPVFEQVLINAQAFVGCSFAGDQFAVCQFSDDAGWVYRDAAGSGLVTVSEGRSPEIEKACQQIAQLKVRNSTNIGAAIELGKQAIAGSTAAFKAFVLLSDGEHNEGLAPELVLDVTPPIFVGGLGPNLYPAYFMPMIQKNTQSRYYSCPHFTDMMLMFNEIRGNIPGVKLLVNIKYERNSGKSTSCIAFRVPAPGGKVRAVVVWPARRFRYTALEANGTDIHVYLRNPLGEDLKIAPWLIRDGMCIFDLPEAQAGEWCLYSEFNLSETIECTCGVFYSA